MNIFFTTNFRRTYKKLISKSDVLKSVFHQHMELFAENPHDPALKDHALKGKLKGTRAFSLGYDLRALYRKEKDIYVFFDIGTHDQVYKK